MQTISLKVLSIAIEKNSEIHFEKGKLKYEDGPDLLWIQSDIQEASIAIHELTSAEYISKERKEGKYDHIYSITNEGRTYYNDLKRRYGD